MGKGRGGRGGGACRGLRKDRDDKENTRKQTADKKTGEEKKRQKEKKPRDVENSSSIQNTCTSAKLKVFVL